MIFSPKLRVLLFAVTSFTTTLAVYSGFKTKPFEIDLVGATDFMTASAANSGFSLKDLTSEISYLHAPVDKPRLPAKPLYPDVGPDKGVELDFLTELWNEWLGSFDCEGQQAELNQSGPFFSLDSVSSWLADSITIPLTSKVKPFI